MSIYHKYNTDNVFMRAILAGLLDVLNNQITYEQAWADDDVETIAVPWFYNQSGDERFMQDFYTHYADCMPPVPADGNFDFFPRGEITYNGLQIAQQRITSRFVQGRYLKEVNGQLQSYVSFLYSVPLTVKIGCELHIDRQISAFKIEQAIIETFYKTVTYYVYFKGMRIGSTVGFPELMNLEKNIQYSFEQDNKIKITFDLEIETYLPVFDKTTEMNAMNRIKGFGIRIYEPPEKSDGVIWAESPDSSTILYKNTNNLIEWNYKQEGAIIHDVDIEYQYTDASDDSWYPIEMHTRNHMYYLWGIPEDFTTFKDPVIIYDETSSINIIRKPILKILPDLSTGLIDASSFKVLDGGYFYTPNKDASITVLLEFKNSSNEISYTNDGAIVLNIDYNVLNETTPVAYIDSSIYFPDTVNYRTINIRIANSVNPDHYSTIENIKIV